MKPILKWAGGKTQLLEELVQRMPKNYGKYIEPFFGGGALFFALKPKEAVISDSNPELINMYIQIAENVEEVIECLKTYQNDSDMFYTVRNQKWEELPKFEAAARTIYLNKTCYNGLYRVNKKGEFNVPFGRYKNPKICDEENLREASELLRRATIICDDYSSVLDKYASKGDFVFLDPPYLPISEYSDFKRYTKEQFYIDDHIKLVAKIKEVNSNRDCFVLLTNSNHPLVHESFPMYQIDVIQTKRHISCNGNSRKGEDAIVTIPFSSGVELELIEKQIKRYPQTRFMGSKSKLLNAIWDISSRFDFNSVLDIFSGSGVVSYMYKAHGKEVISNDYMSMSYIFSKALIENNCAILYKDEAEKLLEISEGQDSFVSDTFKGLYYSDEDNEIIDVLRNNIKKMDDEYKRAIAMMALIRACTKKRPRGIFAYVGDRYNDGRRDLQIPLSQHFLEAVEIINNAIFDNGKQNKASNVDSMTLDVKKPDLIYIDPPYFSPLSDNEYVRRYHFVEGLARDWKGVEIQENTKTKKFKSYPTPFTTLEGTKTAFNSLFSKYKDSIIILSYSSNSLPDKDEIMGIMSKYKKNVELIPIDYKYGFGNQKEAKTHRNTVQEYLFLGY